MNINEKQFRRVMVGTPTIDGKLDVWYVQALLETVKLCAVNEVAVLPLFIAYDSLVQRARNDLITAAYDAQVDDLIFIDADIEWHPQDFLKLLSHNVDMVGGTYRKKNNQEEYVLRVPENNIPNIQVNASGIAEVSGLGTGFLRLSKRCYSILCENSTEYTNGGKKARMVFDISIVDGELHSEDISMCDKWLKSGEKIWFDPTITCNHVGIQKFTGNFVEWYNRVFKPSVMDNGSEIL